jgi:hypothetical protein
MRQGGGKRRGDGSTRRNYQLSRAPIQGRAGDYHSSVRLARLGGAHAGEGRGYLPAVASCEAMMEKVRLSWEPSLLSTVMMATEMPAAIGRIQWRWRRTILRALGVLLVGYALGPVVKSWRG